MSNPAEAPQGHDSAAVPPLLAKPLEGPGNPENPSQPQGLGKLMDSPEDHADNDNDFVDFAETFLSSEPFTERHEDGPPPLGEQLPGTGLHHTLAHLGISEELA